MTNSPLPTVSIDFSPARGWTVSGPGETLHLGCRPSDSPDHERDVRLGR